MNLEFDEVAYLKIYPDVAEAVRQGYFPSGLAHFEQHGRQECRLTNYESLMKHLVDASASMKKTLIERDAQIESLGQTLVDRDHQIKIQRDEVGHLLRVNRELQQQLNSMLSSRSWRLTAPLRKMVAFIRRAIPSITLSFLGKLTQFLKVRRELLLKTSIRQIRASSLFNEEYYLATYPDVCNAGIDSATHYFLYGWREHRNPSAAFSTADYLSDNRDVAKAGVNPLLHYLKHGQQEGRRLMPVPDCIADKSTIDECMMACDKGTPPSISTPEVAEPTSHREDRNDSSRRQMHDDIPYTSIDLEVEAIRASGLLAYQRDEGEGRNVPDSQESITKAVIDKMAEDIRASGLFNEAFYLAMYSDLQPPPLDPIRHYCEHGWREGRNPSDDFDTKFYLKTYSDIRNAHLNPFWHYVIAGAAELRHSLPDLSMRHEDETWFGMVETDIQLLAFYASPDWEALRAGKPMFKGHTQPILPAEELGFYHTQDWQVLSRQAQMAKRHGIRGFCFDMHVDTDGTIAPLPIKRFLERGEIDIGFCPQLAMSSQEMVEPLVKALTQVIPDRRHIRIENRPVLIVAISADRQHAVSFMAELRRLLIEKGIENPFIIGRGVGTGVNDDIATLVDLCEAVLDLPSVPVPGETGHFAPIPKNDAVVVPYSVIASQGVARAQLGEESGYPLYHVVTLGRDNTTRNLQSPLVYTRFHIRDYRRWLDAAICSTRATHPEYRRFVFVNAWNDWNNGLFLEPDRQGGFSRLNETSRALMNLDSCLVMPKVSVIVPNFNHEQFLRRRLDSIYGQTYKNIEVILLDDCSSDKSRSVLDQYAADYPQITRTLYNDKNSGSAFRQWAKGIKAATGDLVWIAESDDYCDERFLEVMVRCFDDEAVLLSYSKSIFVDKNEVPIADSFDAYLSDLDCAGKWTGPYVETAHNEVRSALGIKNTIPNASSVLFKRPISMPLLEDESWLSMRVAGDWVFYLHILRGGKIAYRPDATNFFRRYQGSTAETTYKKETFYREVGLASRTVAALYDVPWKVLERCRNGYQDFYWSMVGRHEDEFERWYDYQAILQARQNRLPNIMVSTMGFFPGGAEILPIRMANEFKRQGLSVILLSTGLNPREDGVRRMLRNDVPVVETSDVDAMKAIIQEFGVEALNTHQWHIQKYPLKVPEVFDGLCAHVASLHGMIEHGEAFSTTEDQLRKADEKVTTWVYTAEKNLVPFSNFGLYDKSSERFIKIPNGMEPPAVVPVARSHIGIPHDAFVLCCVSRAIPDKGWAETIQAVEQARALSGRDIRLILVGNGPVYDEYCRVGTPDFVYLAGFSENSVGYYAAADMGIMLTKFKSESFPLTIVDCLFAGKPYISSDVGDIKNMLSTTSDIAGEVIGLDNWEVPIERAAQVIAAFATDRKKYLEALALVQDVAKRYRIDAVASQYVHLFKSSCDGHRLRNKDRRN